MVQAYAGQLLNQKDAAEAAVEDARQHPLFLATRRLVGALNRLEDNLEHMAAARPEAKPSKELAIFQHENEALKQERENLNNAIAQLQHQYDDLHQVASAIYGKLDDSIKRLTKLIGH